MHFWTPKVEEAIRTAAFWHREQIRRDDQKTPYVVHPFAVALILAQYTDDEDLLAAALLHDILEDTKYTRDELRHDFGNRVEEIVLGVTEDKTIANWHKRKKHYIENLAAAGEGSKLVAAADKIHNLQSMINDQEVLGDIFWQNFGSSPVDQLDKHQEVLGLLRGSVDHPIVDQLAAVYKRAREVLL